MQKPEDLFNYSSDGSIDIQDVIDFNVEIDFELAKTQKRRHSLTRSVER